MRRSVVEFIQTLSPSDLLAVMTPLSPASELSFTRNHASIISAINAFQGRKFRYEPKNLFEQQYSQQSTETVENLRNQVVIGALRGLFTRLGSVRESRKAVVFVSEGFTVLLPPQLRSQNAELQGSLPNGVGPLAGENNPREDTARAFALGDLNLRMRDVFNDANRNNVSVYSLDPRGLATNEFGIDENVGPQQDRVNLQMTTDTLRTLSENTDGRAIVSRNDLARGLQQVVQRLELLLPDWLHVERADRRQVSRDQGEREAAWRRRAQIAAASGPLPPMTSSARPGQPIRRHRR